MKIGTNWCLDFNRGDKNCDVGDSITAKRVKLTGRYMKGNYYN